MLSMFNFDFHISKNLIHGLFHHRSRVREDGEKEEPKEQYHKNNGNLVNIC